MKKIFTSLLTPVNVKHLAASAAVLGFIAVASISNAAITMPDAATVSADYLTIAAWVAGILAGLFGIKKGLSLLRG